MNKYIEVTGKTEDEALAAALKQLGLDRDDVSVEILERAKSGFLGIGSAPAKLRVSYDDGLEEKPETKNMREETPRPEQKEKAEPAKAAERAKPAEGNAAAKIPAGKEESVRKFLNGLFEHMGVKADIKMTPGEEGAINVELSGENMGSLIGRRGETLDAIQHLANYAVNRGENGRTRINIDAEDYRARRAESLRRLAEKVAGKVAKYRRNITLEPMNAYERHVIHTALQDFPGVTTFSTGNEPNRRVVVAYERSDRAEAEQPAPRRGGGKSAPGRRSAHSNRQPKEVRQESPASSEPDSGAQAAAPAIESKYPSREWN